MNRTSTAVTIVAIFALVLWLAWAIHGPAISAFFLHLDVSAVATAGQWGDTFGALNTLFSAMGFTAVLATLITQGNALRRQQDDQHRERFESSFFELLGLMRQLRDEVQFKYSSEYNTAKSRQSTGIAKGLVAFQRALLEARYWLRLAGDDRRSLSVKEIGDLYNQHIHSRYENGLGPYFRIVYSILRRIRDDRVLTEKEKVGYGNLLRSQLSSREIYLAGLNGLAPMSKDFSHLLTQFRILKYAPTGTLRKTLEKYYPAEAFAGRD